MAKRKQPANTNKPGHFVPPDWRHCWPHLLLVFVGLLALYGYTAPRLVALEDDGGFISAITLLGVAHPPGYPLLTLLAHPLSWLPDALSLGSPAWKAHLASGVFGAAACAVLWWIARGLQLPVSAAWLVALGFGVSRAFWSQSIIAEVYSLNVLLLLLLLALALTYRATGNRKLIWTFAFVGGLSLTNHWPLIALAAPALLLLLWPRAAEMLRQLPQIAIAIVIGLLPYAWMVWRSQQAPELSFYGEIRSWDQFWFYVSRGSYAAVDTSATAGWTDKLQFAGFQCSELFWQYSPVGLALALVGFWRQWSRWGTAIAAALTLAFFSTSFALILLLSFDYEAIYRAVYSVYPLPAYAVMGLWIGLGACWIAERFRSNVLVPTALATVCGLSLLLHWQQNDRHNYDYAHRLATGLIDSFPANATVFTQGDVGTFTLGYLQLVEQRRTDLRLLNNQGGLTQPGARLFHPLHTAEDQRLTQLREYTKHATGEVFFFRNRLRDFGNIDHGFYSRMTAPGGGSSLRLPDDLHQLFIDIENATDLADTWSLRHRDETLGNFARWLTLIVHFFPDPGIANRYRPDLERITASNFNAALTHVDQLLLHSASEPPERLLELVTQTNALPNPLATKQERALLRYRHGEILQRLQRNEEAREQWQQAVAVYPHAENDAYTALFRQAATARDCEQWQSTVKSLPSASAFPATLRRLQARMQRQCQATG